ncbi:MAG: hypothetical protein QXO37_06795 [Candidatus Nitrosocaldaceae archaeon]
MSYREKCIIEIIVKARKKDIDKTKALIKNSRWQVIEKRTDTPTILICTKEIELWEIERSINDIKFYAPKILSVIVEFAGQKLQISEVF